MFNSLQARMMRTAISPRLATRSFSNILGSRGPQLEQGLAELDRLGVFDHHLSDHSFGFGFDLVHHLHGLDDADDRVEINLNPDFDVWGRFGRRGAVKSPDH